MRMKLGTLKRIIREAVAKTINEDDDDNLSRYGRSQGIGPQDVPGGSDPRSKHVPTEGVWHAEWDPTEGWYFYDDSPYPAKGYYSSSTVRAAIADLNPPIVIGDTGVPWTPSTPPPAK
ncbi:MAG: hypothetical protein EBZ49_01535 [Proteobacteria bacterium]|nr:hypothetical protein [Pseudomonadota bacterium]